MFDEPIDDEDPTVDLVICLTRRDQAGYWIPNRDRGRWDASDAEKHTALMTAPPKDLRVHRARVIRLATAGDQERRGTCEQRDNHTRALMALGEVFRRQLPEAPRSGKQSLADELREGNTSAGGAAAFGTVSKTTRSFGDAPA